MHPEEIIGFAEILGKLKSTRRAGWVSQVGIEETESVADHSFRCAFLAMVFADLSRINIEKLLRMMLLHDVQEAITGDFDHAKKEKVGADTVKRMERRAIKKVLGLLPPKLGEEYLAVWTEYEEHDSPEAVLAHDVDKIEVVLQALEYEKQGHDPAKLEVFWNSIENQIETPLVKELFEYMVNGRKTI